MRGTEEEPSVRTSRGINEKDIDLTIVLKPERDF